MPKDRNVGHTTLFPQDPPYESAHAPLYVAPTLAVLGSFALSILYRHASTYPDANQTGPISLTSTHINYIYEPLNDSGSLNGYHDSDITPTVDRDFPDVQLGDILDGDQKL
ncbi:uncharacterized protein BO88DRAFT_416972 [Aspergillus vadensis CBS 113365]|uniref:Uncharacterized protein n=1 Tax=Aspergillus vadensis (strain CBS 113365 / IMI 142717 / IBT 24658) TaxID=1448311 RepID=A0A319B3X6_ASPVC|nr:hypothetical protein BO88DRAFT_416972 [Aspergillus vadensis CBS 113365]PYH67486.1 hypothetical protein BO88DRAFT_416972 [Aspergillus vadensis CBS 113365]